MKSLKANKECIKHAVLLILSFILICIICSFLFTSASLMVAFALICLALSMSFSNVILLIQLLKPSFCSKNNTAYAVIHNNLSSEYKAIYLNTECLEKSAIPLHEQRTYMAKLESNGDISIRIETKNSTEFFEEQISDYSWFLKMFRFNE